MSQKLKLTTIDMENALTQRKQSPAFFRTHPVVVNKCAWMFGHEADLISVSAAKYCTEIEIKISTSDFLADFKKKVGHESKYIKQFYYAVPSYMTDYVLERLPENAGLIEVTPMKPVGYVRIIKQAPIHKGATKITDDMLYNLQRLMAMRYWTRQFALRKKLWYDYVDSFHKAARKR